MIQANRRPHMYASRGQTLAEFLVIICTLALTITGAYYFQRRFGGWSGWLWGGLIGFVIVPLIVLTHALFVSLIWEGIPWLPLCRNGCCREADYEGRKFDDGYYHVCKCGDRYERRGRCFLQVTESGERIVCRTWRALRGWHPAGALPRAE